MSSTSLEKLLLEVDLLNSRTLVIYVPHAPRLLLELVELRPLCLQNASGSEKRKPPDTLINIVTLTINPHLLVCTLDLLLLSHSLIELRRRHLQNAPVDTVELIGYALIDRLLEERSQKINSPIDNDQTLNVAIIVINLDLICITTQILYFKRRMSYIARAAFPLPKIL